MKNRNTGIMVLLAMMALSLVIVPESGANDGVIIYKAKKHGNRFSMAEKRAVEKSKYSYSQQAYQGTLIYYGEAANRNSDVYSSRVVSFFVTFKNPTTIRAGHAYGDPNASQRDTRILPRGIRR